MLSAIRVILFCLILVPFAVSAQPKPTTERVVEVKDFKSPLDGFLLKQMGKELYENNIRRAYIGGRPYLLILDEHRNQKFRQLLPLLIKAVDARAKKRDIALFVEGIPQNGIPHFTDHMGGKTPTGLLFGLEEHRLWAAIQAAAASSWLRTGAIQGGEVHGLLYDLVKGTPLYVQLWENLKASHLDADVEEAVHMIDEAVLIGKELSISESKKFLKTAGLLDDAPLCSALFSALAYQALPGVQKDIADLIRQQLDNPDDKEIQDRFQDLVVIGVRNVIWSRYIRKVEQTLPKDTPIIVFAGYLHLNGLIHMLSGPKE